MRRLISFGRRGRASAAPADPAHALVADGSLPPLDPSPELFVAAPSPTPSDETEGVAMFLRVFLTSALGYAVASTLDLVIGLGVGTGPMLLGGALPGGLALGYVQWLGMRDQIPDRRRWLKRTALAWVIANPTVLSIFTPGRLLAFATHALLIGFLRTPKLGTRRNLGLVLWTGASVFGAVVNGYAIEVSRQGLDHGLTALLVLALGGGIGIAAMQALVFAGLNGDFAVTAERLATALGGVGRMAGAPQQSEARMRWVYATPRAA